jgi:hypothetical protein
MMAFGEELLQALRRFGNRIRRRDADDIKTLPPRIGDERFLQKSRSA